MLLAGSLPGIGAHVFSTADTFRVESFGEVVASPDERFLAIVRVRGRSTAAVYMRDFMDGRDRSDIWLYDLQTAVPQNIANGTADRAGFFAPSWSPDGHYLALLSTRANNITLWVWQRSTRTLRQVSRETVELGRPVWMSNSEVVCATPPAGEKPRLFDLETRAPATAMTMWPKAWSGNTVTASVLASGPQLRDNRVQPGRLLKFNIITGRSSTIAKGVYTGVTVSPYDGRIGAFEQVDLVRPDPASQLPNRNPSKYRLVLFDGSTMRTAVELKGSEEPLPGRISWLRDGGVAVRVSGVSSRADWFLITRAGERTNLTSTLKSVPPSLVTVADGRALAGVADGKLWRFSEDGSAPQALLQGTGATIESLAMNNPHAVFVRSQREGRSGLYTVDVRTEELRRIPEPSEQGELMTVLPRPRIAVFSGATRKGTFLWATHLDRGGPQTLMALNEFTADIPEGQLKSLTYKTPAGRELTAWLLLPPDFEEGRRYRTVVSIYPGLVYNAGFRPRASVQSASPYNPQLLASRGYVVLFPSIPLTPEGQPGEPLCGTVEGVLPAVDEAVRTGLVDPDRIALLGHSFGGYGVYGLITQSTRFKAAIAMGGFANLISLYGQLDPRARYEELARDRLIHMVFAESGQFRMGSPPWADMDRYMRNSPLSYVDRVRTPIMMVQGDQDYVPIQQGEEFFTALFRQNKPAVFVRYWGEGHILESPANISDLWRRIYEWLDRYL